nr:hypothetical protein [Halorubrum saccharovorum]
MQRPHIDLDGGGRVGLRITRSALGQVVREAQKTVKLRDGERELREVEVDVLGVTDELEEVVGDEFDLCEEFFPLGAEVPYVADVLDDLLVGERPHRI